MSDMATSRCWTRRQTLLFSLRELHSSHYSLPLLLKEAEADASLLATASTDGGRLPAVFCRDDGYEVLGEQLLWIDSRTLRSDGDALLHLYLDPAPAEAAEGALVAVECESRVAKQRPAEEVLLLVDHFRRAAAEASWVAFYEDEQSLQLVQVVSPPNPPAALLGEALCLDPSLGRIALRRALDLGEPPAPGTPPGQLHLRAYFHDDMAEGDHWIGLSCRFGSFALGIAPGIDDEYGFLNGACPDGAPFQYAGWLRSPLKRSRGWHLFEALLSDGLVHLQVDGHTALRTEALGGSSSEQLWLVAKRGSLGTWGALSAIHSPSGVPAGRLPWKVVSEESGAWQVDSSGSVWRLQEPPPHSPRAQSSQSSDVTEAPEALEPVGSLTVGCWSSVDRARMAEQLDQAMATFLEKLTDAGIVVPSNFQRARSCQATGHQPCFIYNFGTRRLHIQTKKHNGSLLFVVRCGGGFLDFADFVKRHGSLEQLKLDKRNEQEKQVLRLLSVRSNATLRVHEIRQSRPSTSTVAVR